MTEEHRAPEEIFVRRMIERRQELGWSQERLAAEASLHHAMSLSAITKAEWIVDPSRRHLARPLRFNEVAAICWAMGVPDMAHDSSAEARTSPDAEIAWQADVFMRAVEIGARRASACGYEAESFTIALRFAESLIASGSIA